MKLILKNDQAKGLIGKVTFEVTAKVVLSSDEEELVKKYKVSGQELLTIKKKFNLGEDNKFVQMINQQLNKITIKDLMSGVTVKNKDLSEVQQSESNIKEACENFKNFLEAMKAFGGEEIIEY